MMQNQRTRKRVRSASMLASIGLAGGAFAAVVAPAGAAVLHRTSTNVVCNPNVAPGHAVSCGVSVSDLSRTPTAPTGTVALSTNVGSHRGTFSGLGSCTLVPVNSRTSRCTFTYTPKTGQATRIYANYSGDATHARSHGHTNINTVKPPPPPPPTGEPTGFAADRAEDMADLAAAAIAGNRPLHDAILADILADVPGA